MCSHHTLYYNVAHPGPEPLNIFKSKFDLKSFLAICIPEIYNLNQT